MTSKLLKASATAIALLATPFAAVAADIRPPVYKGVRSVVAYYNWTGFYTGLFVGYGSANPVGMPSASSPSRKVGSQAVRSDTIFKRARLSGALKAISPGPT